MPGNFIQDDLDVFTNALDFGSVVTFTPQPSGSPMVIDAIFDDAQEVFDVESKTYLSAAPQLTCKTTDVPGVKVNDLFQIAEIVGVNYYAVRSTDNGDGMTTVFLSKGQVSI